MAGVRPRAVDGGVVDERGDAVAGNRAAAAGDSAPGQRDAAEESLGELHGRSDYFVPRRIYPFARDPEMARPRADRIGDDALHGVERAEPHRGIHGGDRLPGDVDEQHRGRDGDDADGAERGGPDHQGRHAEPFGEEGVRSDRGLRALPRRAGDLYRAAAQRRVRGLREQDLWSEAQPRAVHGVWRAQRRLPADLLLAVALFHAASRHAEGRGPARDDAERIRQARGFHKRGDHHDGDFHRLRAGVDTGGFLVGAHRRSTSTMR